MSDNGFAVKILTSAQIISAGINPALYKGDSPFVGTNGNWWVGTVDTGVCAQGAESDRIAAENTRKTNETARTSAESNRATAEQGRATAEQKRASAESGRASAECTRAANETARNTKLDNLNFGVTMIAPSGVPGAATTQNAGSIDVQLSIPASNLAYATFDIDEDGDLYMLSPDGFDDIHFVIDDTDDDLYVVIE
ncbi:MAG: hypothetical protein RSD95_13880 [Clostridia bacterium]